MREQIRLLYKEMLLYGFADIIRYSIDDKYITIVLMEKALKGKDYIRKRSWENMIRWKLE